MENGFPSWFFWCLLASLQQYQLTLAAIWFWHHQKQLHSFPWEVLVQLLTVSSMVSMESFLWAPGFMKPHLLLIIPALFNIMEPVVQLLSHVWLSDPMDCTSRLPCPSPSPGFFSNSCPLTQWCHPIISSSVTPFSSCLQPFPASGSFPMSWLFISGGQSIGTSASVFPMSIQWWFPLGLTGSSSLKSKELSGVFSNSTIQKHQFYSALPSS